MYIFLKAFIEHFTYLALIAILAATGMGLPIPEDVPLILSGYVCHEHESPLTAIDTNGDGIPDTAPARHVPNRYVMIVAGMIGVLMGDSVVFFVGRRGIDSNNIVARHLRKVLHSKRRERVERHFTKHGNLTVFAGRFLPMLRTIVFAMAGTSRMSYLKFLAIDGFAAAISVPLFILLGYYFASDITHLFHVLDRTKAVVFPIVGAIAAIVISLYIVRRQRRKAELAAASAAVGSHNPRPRVQEPIAPQ